jgi:hypothetical protein
MNVRLKQVDILDNQTYDFYNDRDLYFKLMNKRVNNRLNQIEELNRKLEEVRKNKTSVYLDVEID